ncbi:hypothetical protein PINS_up010855 [Pythium insidiosum]|nr:hypothetical protein PINS_up010855 [Pythium insidiosum]
MLFCHFDIGFSYDAASWGARAKQLLEDAALDVSAAVRNPLSDDKSKGLVYAPEWTPGRRVPHVACQVNGAKLSTMAMVDALAPPGSGRFLLLVDGATSRVDAGVVDEFRKTGMLDLVTIVQMTEMTQEKVNPEIQDVHHAVVDASGPSVDAWHAFSSQRGQAVPIRPDGHIADCPYEFRRDLEIFRH